jgi:hypothetical protein
LLALSQPVGNQREMILLCLRMGEQIGVPVMARATPALFQQDYLCIMSAQLVGKPSDILHVPQHAITIASQIQAGGPRQTLQGASIVETILKITPFAALPGQANGVNIDALIVTAQSH